MVRKIKPGEAVAALGALAHETRLALFRLLLEHGPDGMAAGAIAERLGIPPSSLSFHLQALTHARLVTQRRVSRQIFYATDFACMNALVRYLTENCCGAAESCAPICRPQSSRAASQRRRSA
jgi:ArsR family transcriptional regulator